VPNWAKVRRELSELERRRGTVGDRSAEAARFDWYASGCPCGLAPGDCREHPRARLSQRPPAGDWRTWLVLAGRGFGKTRCAAEWIRHRVETGAARRVALVGATAADVRDVMVEGPSGILAVSPPRDRPRYEPSKRRLTWPNGAVATTFSAEEPDRLRGPQSDCAWLDELAAFPYPQALDNLLFGLRLGADPRLCVTTTPKPVRLVTELVADPTTGSRGGRPTRTGPTWRRRSSSGS
jgi:phage terminase large subunit-like protein